MLLFLLVAALIAVSLPCKIAIAAGLVPAKPATAAQRIVHRLARVVGRVERKTVRRQTSGSGASGDY